jgi:hypothetical protein
VLKIYPRQNLFGAAAATNDCRVRSAATARTDCGRSAARCMMSETFARDGHMTLFLPIHNTTVPDAIFTSMPTWLTLHTHQATIPSAWSLWRYASLWKMACHIGLRHGICGGIIGYLFRGQPFRTGLKRRGKKSAAVINGDEYMDTVLADFSGYIAADEIYDGPFCILFIVDNRTFRRLCYEVLDHNPTNEDITRFFRRFKQMLDNRNLTLKGITTDGSPLYPEPIAEIFPGVWHQVCEFHIIKEITKEIIKAVAQVRKGLKQTKIHRPKGRPCGTKAKRIAHKNEKIQKRIADMFDNRYLFVKHSLTPREQKALRRITIGLRHLRALRRIMDEIYRLFDRRCRTDTALKKLARLRRKVGRFVSLANTLKKLWSPNLEKALTFLDDSLLPSTSNAVERANRRHRKMQKSIYRVRTVEHIHGRIATDMQRDLYAVEQARVINVLHCNRINEKRKAG